MKITKRQLRKIIKEEIERATEGLTYSQHGQESGPDDDAAVALKGYRDALANKDWGFSIPDKRAGTVYSYDGGYDRGLAQLLDQGDISQEEYDAKLTPARG